MVKLDKLVEEKVRNQTCEACGDVFPPGSSQFMILNGNGTSKICCRNQYCAARVIGVIKNGKG